MSSRDPGAALAEGCLAFAILFVLALIILGMATFVVTSVVKAVFGL